MVNAKDMATFLLGATAGAAFLKYHSMTDKEKEEMMEKFKKKAEELKVKATETAEKAEGYFEELLSKSEETMKDIFDKSESFFDDLFAPKGDQHEGEAKV